MKIETSFPYDAYRGYLIINSENRVNVSLVHEETKIQTTTSFARYIMSVNEKRFLEKFEQVDHINGDKTDDRIENLQILTSKENNIKKNVERQSTLKMVKMVCPNCNIQFDKPLNQTYIQKGGRFNACSKICLHQILKKGMSVEQLTELGQKQIIQHYRK